MGDFIINDISALESFHNQRKVFSALVNVLLHKELAQYLRTGDRHSVVLGELLCRSIMVNDLPSGVQVSLPCELSAIAECEADMLVVYRDAIAIGMKSLYRNQGDSRILNIIIPTTHAMSQCFRECKTIDVGTYEESKNVYSIKLHQYFEPKYTDVGLFDSVGIHDNWVQLTVSGDKCASLKAQNIDITSDYKANMEYLKRYSDDTEGELDEFYKVALCIRLG